MRVFSAATHFNLVMLRSGNHFKPVVDLEHFQSIKCPLSRQVMTHPVVLCSNGLSYEKDLLDEHLSSKDRAPSACGGGKIYSTRRGTMVNNRTLAAAIPQLASLGKAHGGLTAILAVHCKGEIKAPVWCTSSVCVPCGRSC